MIVWAITTREAAPCKKVVICQGRDREDAKREALPTLGGDPDTYVVEPLSRSEDTVVVKLKINGAYREV